MVKTLAQMVEKGRAKLQAKSGTIATNWANSKSVMKTEYNAMPFGPQTKAAYAAGVDLATHPGVDVEKWVRKYQAGVSR